MLFYYIKAIHIIFIVTWFAGMFYMPRFFIYNTEALQKPELEKNILQRQFGIMMRRLWYGITWPSAVLTLIFGSWTWYLYGSFPDWLAIKLCFVAGLYAYHFSLHAIYRQETKGIFKYSSQQLRVWNEVATIFLLAIVMIAVVKQKISLAWGLGGLLVFILVLMSAIRIYKAIRK
jgi:putative membrane protein